jgi:hypothetical protein
MGVVGVSKWLTIVLSRGYLGSVTWQKGQQGNPGTPGGSRMQVRKETKHIRQLFRERLPEVVDVVLSIVLRKGKNAKATIPQVLIAAKLAFEYGEGRPMVISDEDAAKAPADIAGMPPAEQEAALLRRSRQLAELAEQVGRGVQ